MRRRAFALIAKGIGSQRNWKRLSFLRVLRRQNYTDLGFLVLPSVLVFGCLDMPESLCWCGWAKKMVQVYKPKYLVEANSFSNKRV